MFAQLQTYTHGRCCEEVGAADHWDSSTDLQFLWILIITEDTKMATWVPWRRTNLQMIAYQWRLCSTWRGFFKHWHRCQCSNSSKTCNRVRTDAKPQHRASQQIPFFETCRDCTLYLWTNTSCTRQRETVISHKDRCKCERFHVLFGTFWSLHPCKASFLLCTAHCLQYVMLKALLSDSDVTRVGSPPRQWWLQPYDCPPTALAMKLVESGSMIYETELENECCLQAKQVMRTNVLSMFTSLLVLCVLIASTCIPLLFHADHKPSSEWNHRYPLPWHFKGCHDASPKARVETAQGVKCAENWSVVNQGWHFSTSCEQLFESGVLLSGTEMRGYNSLWAHTAQGPSARIQPSVRLSSSTYFGP